MASLSFREKELIVQGLKRQIKNKETIIKQFKNDPSLVKKYEDRKTELEILIEKVEWM